MLIENTEFQYTYWSDNHGTERTPENRLTIRYLITPAETGSALSVTHSNLKPGAYHDMMVVAWDHILGQFKDQLEAK